MHVPAFDGLAADYDADFTGTPLGGLLRSQVWSRLAPLAGARTEVLDLGCGTGEDAVWLAGHGARVTGLDASPEMVRMATLKAQRLSLQERARFLCLPAERLAELPPGTDFDLVTSNFGALNCVADLPALARELGARTRPGSRLLWVLMGRHVPWEWVWYGVRGDRRRALRRLAGRTRWRGMPVYYPTPGTVTRALQPWFRTDAVRPLGFALPPTYVAGWVGRHPRVLAALAGLERLGRGSAALARIADHYIVEATRVPVAEMRA